MTTPKSDLLAAPKSDLLVFTTGTLSTDNAREEWGLTTGEGELPWNIHYAGGRITMVGASFSAGYAVRVTETQIGIRKPGMERTMVLFHDLVAYGIEPQMVEVRLNGDETLIVRTWNSQVAQTLRALLWVERE